MSDYLELDGDLELESFLDPDDPFVGPLSNPAAERIRKATERRVTAKHEKKAERVLKEAEARVRTEFEAEKKQRETVLKWAESYNNPGLAETFLKTEPETVDAKSFAEFATGLGFKKRPPEWW